MNITKFYTNKKIKQTRLAILSDIHYYSGYPIKQLNKFIEQTKEGNPDYIVIVGDTIDDSGESDFKTLREFLTKLSSIAPTLVVIGNHELKNRYRRHWRPMANQDYIDLLKSIDNITFLSDKSYKKDNLNFYGFNLSFNHYEILDEEYNSFCEEVSRLSPNLEDDNYNIILYHSPINIYKYLENNPKSNLNKANLILCGHMHNGLLHYTFTNLINKLFKTTRSFVSPHMKFFIKYAQGKNYERDGYTFQGLAKLSKATGFLHFFDRFYCKRVGFIDIIPKEKN